MAINVRGKKNGTISVTQGSQASASIVVKNAVGEDTLITSLRDVDARDLQDNYFLIYNTASKTWQARGISIDSVFTGDYVANVAEGPGIVVSNIQGSSKVPIISLAPSGVEANVYGNSSPILIPVLVVDTYGRVTSASTVEISNIQLLESVKDVDGPGSGLDADTLDGLQGNSYALGSDLTTANVAELINLYFTPERARQALSNSIGVYYDVDTGTFSIGQSVDTTSDVTFNNVTVSGNLFSNDITADNIEIRGNLLVLGTTTTISTEEINLADNKILLNSNHVGTPTQDAGIAINRGNEANVEIVWNETANVWQFTNNGTNYYLLPTNTADLVEGSNLYFTNTRARNSITVVDTGGDGALVYNAANGQITFTGPSAAETRAHITAGANILYSNATGIIALDSNVLTTANVVELTNLYFTAQRARDSISAGANILYNSATGVISLNSNVLNTSNVVEGTNLYYTNARARNSITVVDTGGDGSLVYNSANGQITYTGPSATEVRQHLSGNTGVYYNNTTGTFSIGQNVDTTSNVTFNNVTVAGSLFSNDITADSVEIKGNLVVLGSTTTINTEEINLADNKILLNSNHTGSATQDAGISVNRGSDSNVEILWNETLNVWQFTNNGSTYYLVPTSTTDLIEGTNLYFTNARARESITAGANILYDSATGIIALDSNVLTTANVVELTNLYFTTDRARQSIAAGANILYDTVNGVVSLDSNVLNTSNIVEGDNLYFTNARARESITAGSNVIYDSATGTISLDSNVLTTANVVEDTNLYFTNTRSRDSISVVDAGGDGSLVYDSANGQITYTGPSSSEARAHFSGNSGVYYNETTGTFSIGQNVDTTSDVIFSNVTVNGSLFSNDITADEVVVKGNLIVDGTTTTVNTEEINLADNKILLNSNHAGTPTQDAGVTINRGDQANVEILWNETLNVWQFTNDGSTYYLVPTSTTDLAEGANLYYTNTRARESISVVDTGGDGSLVYDSANGQFTFTGPSAQEVRAHFSAGTGIVYDSANGTITLSNTTVTAGTYGNSVTIPVITVDDQGRISNISTTLVAGVNDFTASGNTFTISTADGNSFSASIQPDSVVLGRDTTGAYVSNLVAGTGVTLTDLGDETSTPTISIGQNVDPSLEVTFANVAAHTFTGNVVTDTASINELTVGNLFANYGNIDTIRARDINLTGNVNSTVVQTVIFLANIVSGINATFTGNVDVNDLNASGIISGDGSGIFNIPNSSIVGLTTANVAEVSNLYFTTQRARDSISAGTGVYYDNTTGVVSIGQDVSTNANVTFGDLVVTGNLAVLGNATTLSAEDLIINDPIVYMGANNTVDDAVDLGWVVHYTDSESVGRHAGMFRDATDKKFKLFDNSYHEIGVIIDTSNAHFRFANLVIGGLEAYSGDFTGNVVAPLFIGNVIGNVEGRISTLDNHTTSNLAEGINLYFTNARAREALIAGANILYDASTGTISLDSNVLNTSNVVEGTNLYYTNTRARESLSAGSNVLYDSATGTISLDSNVLTTANVVEDTNLYFTNARAREALTQGSNVLYDSATGTISLDSNVLNTSNVVEGDNLYYTNTRAREAIVAGANILYDTATGTISLDSNVLDTSNVVEGTNLYYTNTRARESISVVDTGGDGSIVYDSANGQITYTGPSSTEARAHFSGNTGVYYNETTGTFSIGQNVDTTSDVTFSNVTVNGSLFSNDITADEVVVKGNLIVDGTTTTVNTQEINLADNKILLNSNQTGTPTQDAGVIINRGDQANVEFIWNETLNVWQFTNDGAVYHLVPTSTTDLAEGANLYYTNTRAREALTAGANILYDPITGTISLDSNVLNTSNVVEGTNLYFTVQRARDSISVVGAGSYDNTTGVITVTGGVTSVGGAVGDITNVQLAAAITESGLLTTANVIEEGNLYFTNARAFDAVANIITTSEVIEGSNLYYTDQRARDAISVTGAGSYDNTTGIITVTGGVTSVGGAVGDVTNVQLVAAIVETGILTTANVAEEGNLYFTNARVSAAISSQTLDNATFSGNLTAGNINISGTYTGDGSGLTNIPNSSVNGLTTENVIEIINLYFTNTRAREALTAGFGIIYDTANGIIRVNPAVLDTGGGGGGDTDFGSVLIFSQP